MSNRVTFEQVEQLAVQLPPPEQLKLVAHISEWLSQLMPTTQGTDAECQRRDYAARVEAFLAACDEVAEQIEGEFDSAEDLRQIQSGSVDEHEQQEYAQRVEAFLRMSDEMAAETIGEVDLTEDIRQIREERTARL
ncbi:hypothetical protein HYR99_13220 [Candidatus Poribacteria bacterium]|nr:hypothetical protein [Candidatus Poribacteria bacterium]